MKIKPFTLNNLTIKTERLVLELISQDFAEVFFKEFNEEVAAYTKHKPHASISEVQAYIRGQEKEADEGRTLNFVLLRKENREFIGCCGMHELSGDTPVAGIWIKAGAWGKGYAKEALGGVVDFIREHFAFECIKFPADRRNTSSCRIPESLGASVQKEYTSYDDAGNEMDIVEYWLDYFPQKGIKAGKTADEMRLAMIRILENAKLLTVATSVSDSPNVWFKSFIYDYNENGENNNVIYIAVMRNHRMLAEFSHNPAVAAVTLPVISVESVRMKNAAVVKSRFTAADMKTAFLKKYPLYVAERPNYDSYDIYEIHFDDALVTMENGYHDTVMSV